MSIVIEPLGAAPRSAVTDRVRAAASRSHPRDGWPDALAKLVPGETILAFTAALRMPGLGDAWLSHGAIALLLAMTIPLALWSSARRVASPAHGLQYAVRSAVFVLFGVGWDDVLRQPLGAPAWILQLGALVLPVLAALVLRPPGAQSPPPRRRE